MSYQVLARKLRPGTFDALVGQDHVVRALRHALDHDRLHHAYLFTGTRGVGKTTIARVLAKCLNCEQGVSSSPCNECSVCVEVNENRFIDLIEVDAASRTRVDDTRELLENAQYLPTRGRYKVYLVDEVHMLSASSFNALLKTLEEPPEHVKFLLATTDPKKVPVTVLSRCLQFQLKNISAQRTAAYLSEVLEDEGISFDAGALEVISRSARGSMRDALSITDQAIAYGQGKLLQTDVVEMLGLVGRDEVGALLDALEKAEPAGVLAVVAELADRSADFDALLSELLGAFHEMAVAQATGNEPARFSPEAVQLYYQIGLMGYRDLQIAPDPRAGVEMTLLRMLAFAPDDAGMKVPRAAGAERQTTTAATTGPGDTGASETAEVDATSDTRQMVGSRADTAVVNAAPSKTEEVVRPIGMTPASPGSAIQTEWFQLVSRLELRGVARMIVENSLPVEESDERLRLMLDRAHDTLLSDAQVKAVQRAVCDALGKSLTVEVFSGDPQGETPAQAKNRLASERQRDAEQTMQSSGLVRSLLDEFGGRLDEVRPVDLPGEAGDVPGERVDRNRNGPLSGDRQQ